MWAFAFAQACTGREQRFLYQVVPPALLRRVNGSRAIHAPEMREDPSRREGANQTHAN
jgi:hypothetical protein